MAIKLFARKTIVVPTFWGWLLAVVFIAALSLLLFSNIYSFLAYEKPASSKVLVIEGWIPDTGLKEAIAHYRLYDYEYMVITGVPITQWTFASPYSNMADASARSMKEMHFSDSIYTVPIPTAVMRDRTYATAIALDLQWDTLGIVPENFDLFTMGAHSRRSKEMFKKVFGSRLKGVIIATDPSFDGPNWYKSSRGFRIVFSELVSYFYTKLFFRPDAKQMLALIKEGYYKDKLQGERFEKDRYFMDLDTSPLADSSVNSFMGIDYFPVDKSFVFNASFEIDTSSPSFRMATTTDRMPEYRKYGTLQFSKADTLLTLTAYQNLDMLKKNSTYKGLFIPFKDKTNGKLTYGGGRYLDVDIPENQTLTIDFNRAYNPYCAYDSKWSCPIPPYENHLQVSILAGEKKFH
ncbi:MAG: DUF1684 domain-containing protein [Bacteroidetes bacterium]|nr:DUF1684 domain-containing protein [Bacteroidota bacterium]